MKYLLAMFIMFATISTSYAYTCNANMVDRRGQGPVIRHFNGQSYYDLNDACRNALNYCRSDLQRRQSQGHNLSAVCIVNRRPPQQTVTAYCTYSRMERDYYGSWVVERITRRATGPAYQNPKARACSTARNDCNRRLRYNQWCQEERRRIPRY